MIATTVWELVAAHMGTFLFGVVVGLGAASRYRIVRTKEVDRDAPRDP